MGYSMIIQHGVFGYFVNILKIADKGIHLLKAFLEFWIVCCKKL